MIILQSSSSAKYQSVTLDNGLRIVHCQSDSPVMYCGFMVDCGTRDEKDTSLYGMAHFVEHILFKGTELRDAWHINNRMESVGGELNAFTTKEETTFYAIGLNKDFRRACDLLCDLVCHPTAPQHELEKEREVVIDEIMSYKDTPSELIFDEFENQLFAGHALGHNILGNEQTVRSFDHQKCIRFIKEHYTPDKMVFFHQGKTSFTRIVQAIMKYFDETAFLHADNEVQQMAIESLPEGGNEEIEEATPRFQSHVLIGAKTYPIGHPKAAALALANNILGGPGMNSRLGLELREHRGLVYTVDSSVTSYTDNGYIGIYFGCDHHDVERCLKICNREIEKLREPISSNQLEKAKKQLCGQLGVSMANLENSAIAMAKNQLRLGHVERLEETCARIEAVTPALFNEVTNEVFNAAALKTVMIQ